VGYQHLASPTTDAEVLRPHQLFIVYHPAYRILCRAFFNIGRKHKSHRQQAQQEKPWRNSEKGRKGKGKGRRGKMGQDESRVVDPDEPPQTLNARTVEALAQYMERAQKIVVMVRIATT
jgi:hypothetical protein